MSRIFLLGAGPMMDGGARRVTAHAVRTWHFATALRRAGHDLAICTVSQTISPLDPMKRLAEHREKEDVPYENLDMRMGDMLAYVRERCETFHPDGVIGVSTEPASWACRLRPTVPVWADLHGWVMAEAQLKALRDGNDDILSYFWQQERPVLRRADKISTVSRAQRFAVLGELATIGRLNRHTADYEIVVTIPSSVDPESGEKACGGDTIAPLVGQEKAFVVLWCGGFNTWTDPAMLFEALEWAMARDPTVHFVATGGPIPGHADTVFDLFRKRVDGSSYRARYHLVGWVAAEEFPGYLAHSHVTLCVDFPCIETSVGTRTRLLGAMAQGLPVVLTRGTELSEELERAGVGCIVAPNKPQAVGEKIAELARDRERAARLGQQACSFVRREYSIGRTFDAVLRWAERPCFAPDNALKRAESPTIFEAAMNPLEADARALDHADIRSLLEAQRDLERLRSRWPFRLWRRLRRRKKS